MISLSASLMYWPAKSVTSSVKMPFGVTGTTKRFDARRLEDPVVVLAEGRRLMHHAGTRFGGDVVVGHHHKGPTRLARRLK